MENGIMMQYFEWYLPDDGQLWKHLKEDAKHLRELGVTAVWIPPCYKATGSNDVGYGAYDLYDLGEFDQKGSIRTKYGTKEELHAAIDACHDADISVYADLVLNHKAGADEKETFEAFKVDPENRTIAISDTYEIEAWTKFTFPGRNGKYSDFIWDYNCFNGIDFDVKNDDTGIFLIPGETKDWNDNTAVDNDKGNFNYLMFADIDYGNEDVRNETLRWVKWFIDQTHVDGFRLDAVKHTNRWFLRDMIKMLRKEHPDLYVTGEYWKSQYDDLEKFMQDVEWSCNLFDVPLHFNFEQASKLGKDYDLRTIYDNTIVSKNPTYAVTFVDNHDSQPGQSLESYIEPWFKPIAYAFILLRKRGYPCLFYGDYYGIGHNTDHYIEPFRDRLDNLLELRASFAYGDQDDYFDDPNVVGWVRHGSKEHPKGLACLVSNAEEACKRMFVGENYAGKQFFDYTGNRVDHIEIGEDGFGEFTVNAGSVSVWVEKE